MTVNNHINLKTLLHRVNVTVAPNAGLEAINLASRESENGQGKDKDG